MLNESCAHFYFTFLASEWPKRAGDFFAMTSALEIVAFSNATKIQGILALIEVAQRALDEEGQYLAAVFLEHARDAYLDQVTKNSNLESSYNLAH